MSAAGCGRSSAGPGSARLPGRTPRGGVVSPRRVTCGSFTTSSLAVAIFWCRGTKYDSRPHITAVMQDCGHSRLDALRLVSPPRAQASFSPPLRRARGTMGAVSTQAIRWVLKHHGHTKGKRVLDSYALWWCGGRGRGKRERGRRKGGRREGGREGGREGRGRGGAGRRGSQIVRIVIRQV